jgi:glucose/arabinose dehydrogenase
VDLPPSSARRSAGNRSSPASAAASSTTAGGSAALQGQCLFRIPIEGTRLGTPTRLLAGRFGRLRTVAKAPDGSLWVMTSNRDGRGQRRPGDDKIIAVAV